MIIQVFSEAIPENIREMSADLDENISMREEYVYSLVKDFDIQLEEIKFRYEKYSEEELSNMRVFIHNRFNEVCMLVPDAIGKRIENLDVQMAARILTFCMFEEVDGEAGHELADAVLLSLINHLLTDRTEADLILNLFRGIYKWYS